MTMHAGVADKPEHELYLRDAERSDLDALVALEHRAFATDRLSRQGIARLIQSRSAEIIVAQQGVHLVGVVVVLFRKKATAARLYSIAVAPHAGGRGLAAMLLNAAEQAALAHGARLMRLEVNARNHAAIKLYRKNGYREFGHHRRYYEDGADALRFEKRLMPRNAALAQAPPYFHQTTEFTCGPACLMMAIAWADRAFKPAPACELGLWREATTIFSEAGPGGCEPYGMAVAAKRHGLDAEIFVSRTGYFFLEKIKSAEKRRVVQLTQESFQQQARALGIPTHLTPVSESVLMAAFDAGRVAIVLVSGYHMVDRGRPHWIFAFGHEGRSVLMHDPAAIRDDKGVASVAETYAVPWPAFERVARLGRERLSAAIVIRKGSA
jgi:ribosomal protein S18 acetylase RimI-like enzyme